LETTLLSEAQRLASDQGIDVLYSRVWYTNSASIRAFRKSGWVHHLRYLGVRLFNFASKGIFVPTLKGLTQS